MFLKIIKKITSLDYKIFFGTGFFLLFISLFLVLFVNVDALHGLINNIRGYEVSRVGLRKIDFTYLLPVKIIFILFGLLLTLIGYWVKYPGKLDLIYSFIKKIFLKISEMKIFKILFIIFLISFILRMGLMSTTSEMLLTHDAVDYIDAGKSLLNGEGLISHTVFYLDILPKTIPYPVTLYPPLFPFLIYLSYKIFGVSFLSPIFINSILNSLLPVLLFLIVWQMFRSKKTALMAAIFLVANRIWVGWSNQVLTEALYIFFVLLVFVFMTKKDKWWNWGLVGLFFGAAWLVRYQALFLLSPVILIYLFLKYGFKKSISKIFLIIISFLLVVSPWLARNYHVFGSLLYLQDSASRNYLDFNIWGRTVNSAKPLIWFLQNDLWMVLKTFFKNLILMLVQTPFNVLGGIFIFTLCLYGIFRNIKTKMINIMPLLVYLVVNYLFFALIRPYARYLYPLIPILLIFSAIGIREIFNDLGKKINLNSNKQLFVKIIIILFILSTFGGLVMGGLSASGFLKEDNENLVMAMTVSNYFNSNTENVTVMVDSRQPCYLHYFSPKISAIIAPLNQQDFLYLIKKYNINYVVLPRYKNSGSDAIRDNQLFDLIIGNYSKKELVYADNSDFLEIKIYKILGDSLEKI